VSSRATKKKSQYREQLFRQVATLVNATVIFDKPRLGDLVFHRGVVQVRIEHDCGEGEHVRGVCHRKRTFFSMTLIGATSHQGRQRRLDC